MDEQYPVRSIANYSRATSRSRKDNVRFKATSLTSQELSHQRYNPSFDKRVKSNRRQLLSSRGNSISVLIYEEEKRIISESLKNKCLQTILSRLNQLFAVHPISSAAVPD